MRGGAGASRQSDLGRWLVLILWAVALFRLFGPPGALGPVPGLLLAVFVAIALVRAGWAVRLMVTGLAAATAVLCVAFGVWASAWDGFDRAIVFAAFLATVLLLRATAERRPEVRAARLLFATLEQSRRSGGVLLGSHLLGSVLTAGAIAMIAPIVGEDAPAAERRHVALTVLRGLNLVVTWTPFAVAIAVASHYLPSVPLWQSMPLGLVLAGVALTFSFAVFDRGGTVGDLLRALASFRPVVLPVIFAALTVAALTAATPLSTLGSLILSMPVLCLGALARQGRASLAGAVRETWRNLDRPGPELCLLAFSLALGSAFEAALAQTSLLEWLRALALPPFAVIAAVIASMVIAAIAGLHPIVSMTVLLVLFTSVPTGVADLVLMQSALVGWGLGTAASVAGIAVTTGAVLFRIPPFRLVFPENALFALCCGIVLALMLGALNLVIAA